MTAKSNKSSSSKGNKTLSKSEQELRDEIVEEAKKLALTQTSSAFELVRKARELLKIENMQRDS